jgi:hypothetical protein
MFTIHFICCFTLKVLLAYMQKLLKYDNKYGKEKILITSLSLTAKTNHNKINNQQQIRVPL